MSPRFMASASSPTAPTDADQETDAIDEIREYEKKKEAWTAQRSAAKQRAAEKELADDPPFDAVAPARSTDSQGLDVYDSDEQLDELGIPVQYQAPAEDVASSGKEVESSDDGDVQIIQPTPKRRRGSGAPRTRGQWKSENEAAKEARRRAKVPGRLTKVAGPPEVQEGGCIAYIVSI
jgi:hypothetical protein